MTGRTLTGERWVVVGAGVLGLALALRLRDRGAHVRVLEAAPEVGGLAGAWELGDVRWDRHYHVTLWSDLRTRALMRELGLEDEMRWRTTRTGCYAGDGRVYSVSSPAEFLRFPALRMADKVRLGATMAAASVVRDGRRMEGRPLEAWLRRCSGDRAFEAFWLPLLRAKLGDAYRDASAAFIWATIRRLGAARRSGLGEERFGYVPGGWGRAFDVLAARADERGVVVETATPVAAVRRGTRSRVVVETADGAAHHAEGVVVTLAAPQAARVCPELAPDERRRLEGVRYQGLVCASVLLPRPLGGFYLTNITDPGAPFTGVVEMTALVDPAELSGCTLVYLPKYVAPDDPLLERPDEEILEHFLRYLWKMYPSSLAEPVAARVSRVRQVFAVPTIRYSEHMPPIATAVPGLLLAGSAHLPFATLNVDDTLGLVDRVMAAVDASPAARDCVPEPEA